MNKRIQDQIKVLKAIEVVRTKPDATARLVELCHMLDVDRLKLILGVVEGREGKKAA